MNFKLCLQVVEFMFQAPTRKLGKAPSGDIISKLGFESHTLLAHYTMGILTKELKGIGLEV